MSAIKRSRPSRARPTELSEQHAAKKIKSSHAPAAKRKEGLDFLVDEDARQGRKVDGKLTNGVLDKRTTRVDESKAVVAPEGNADASQVIDISSAEEESSEYESDAENITKPQVNGRSKDQQALAGAEDVDMLDGEAEDAAEQEEPSFGDMLSARHPEPIDVQSAFPQDEQHAIVPSSGKQVLAAPTGTSLSTVLTQALRTNDKDMLETCFQMADQQSIRMTIQRLQSHLVGPLMQRLAERIHRRPGRTGHLMTWIQWSLVAHGGYLVTQPEIMGKLRALNQVLRERAQGLQPLLQLKGKLDMLGAQLELRRQTLATSARAQDDEDDEAGVLYIEGRDDDDEGSEAELAALERPSKRKNQAQGEEYHTASESDESDDEAGAANGFAAHDGSVSAEDEDDEDVQNGMLDLEAEESGEDDDDEGSEDDASEGSEDEDVEEENGDESEIEVKQPKPQTLNRKR
jgi:U3 small nucleolar RNA-associated protein 5